MGHADLPLLKQAISRILTLVEETARDILQAPDSGYTASDPIFRIVSPLAEGADRLIAWQAVARKWELDCPIPFPRQEYERDFETVESRDEFNKLLTRKARRVFELDGNRSSPEREGESYESAGRMVLRQCDLLIAIWSGGPAQGRGGTAQIVDEAVRLLGIPTVWIRADKPHELMLHTGSGATPFRAFNPAELAASLRASFLQPAAHRGKRSVMHRAEALIAPTSAGGRDLRDRWFTEKARRWNAGFLFRFFSHCTETLRPGGLRFRLGPVHAEATATEAGNEAFLKQHHRWADNLADFYGNLYRSSFLLNYTFSALAVMCALMPVGEHLFTLLELVLIASIIFLTVAGNAGSWHVRWLHYRLLAELLRCNLFLAPLGRGVPSALSEGGEHSGTAWVYWHCSALFREAGMPAGEVNEAYCTAALAQVDAAVNDQIRYHSANTEALHRIHTHLHLLGICFFFATLVACLLHLNLGTVGELLHLHARTEEQVRPWLVLCAAVFPAAGAAIAGILSQAEFRLNGERSREMAVRLTAIPEAGSLSAETSWLNAIGRRAEAAASAMVSELSGWRRLSEGKVLGLPG